MQILYSVCGVNCQADSQGQFEFVELSRSESEETIGDIYDSSIVSNKNINDGNDVMLQTTNAKVHLLFHQLLEIHVLFHICL